MSPKLPHRAAEAGLRAGVTCHLEMDFFVVVSILVVCFVPDFVLASCENSITVQAPGFEYVFNDVAASAGAPLGQNTVSDSIYHARMAQNYRNLARGLAVAAQIYRCTKTSPEAANVMAREAKRARLGFWQSAYHDLRRLPHPTDLRNLPPPDELERVFRRCAPDSTAILYSVQIGSFALKHSAIARQRHLAGLVSEAHSTQWDSTRIVDWWNWSCAGDHRPDLFMLAPEDAPGPGYKVMHGLFIERDDAVAARTSVVQRFQLPGVVVRIRVTGPIVFKALHPDRAF